MRIACLLGPEFEDSEFRIPYDAFRNAGHEVVIVGIKQGERLAGKKGKERATVELSIDKARPEHFDALFIPGGHSPDHLRADDRVLRFARAFDERRPILAICHGPQILISAGMVRGRTMTAWKTVQKDLAAAGVRVRDEEVVVDGNLVTSRQPDDIPAFVRESLRLLGAGAEAHV